MIRFKCFKGHERLAFIFFGLLQLILNQIEKLYNVFMNSLFLGSNCTKIAQNLYYLIFLIYAVLTQSFSWSKNILSNNLSTILLKVKQVRWDSNTGAI